MLSSLSFRKSTSLRHTMTRTFFEGVASSTLARHTHRLNWMKTGEEALGNMMNYENRAELLQAEIHYLNRYLKSADVAYKASIVSPVFRVNNL